MEKFEVLLTGNGDSGLYRSLLSVFNLETPAKVLHVFVPHVRREAALNSLEMVRADTKQDGPQFRIHSLAFETRLEEFIEHVEEDKFCFLSENDMFLPDHSNIFNSLTTDIDLSLTSYWQRKKFGNFKIVHPKNGNEWIPLSAFAAKKENAIKENIIK